MCSMFRAGTRRCSRFGKGKLSTCDRYECPLGARQSDCSAAEIVSHHSSLAHSQQPASTLPSEVEKPAGPLLCLLSSSQSTAAGEAFYIHVISSTLSMVFLCSGLSSCSTLFGHADTQQQKHKEKKAPLHYITFLKKNIYCICNNNIIYYLHKPRFNLVI